MEFEDKRRKLISRVKNYTENSKVIKRFERDLDELIELGINNALEGVDTMSIECNNGGLWLTSMGRIVLDDHNCEAFAKPHDKKLMDKKELSFGISVKEFQCRLIDALHRRDEQ